MKAASNALHSLDIEKKRLAELLRYNILNNYSTSGTFQHVVALAAHIFKVPIALVNFVAEEVVLIESSTGVEGLREVSRNVTICSQAILQDEVTVIENAKEEPCLQGNPFVHGEFGLQFYAAAPLKTIDGFRIGALAIFDKKPRVFSKQDATMLQGLAAIVMEELEERQLMTSTR